MAKKEIHTDFWVYELLKEAIDMITKRIFMNILITNMRDMKLIYHFLVLMIPPLLCFISCRTIPNVY